MLLNKGVLEDVNHFNSTVRVLAQHLLNEVDALVGDVSQPGIELTTVLVLDRAVSYALEFLIVELLSQYLLGQFALVLLSEGQPANHHGM